MKKITVLALSLALMTTFTGSAFAQSAPSISDLQAQIQLLIQQVTALQSQITTMQSNQGEIQQQVSQIRQEFQSYLRLGVASDEVEDLQEFLAQDSSIYPEGLITGYFGSLTKRAVEKFQSKYGIEQAGVVGPKTRARLNSLLSSGGFTPPGLAKRSAVNFAGGDDDVTTSTSPFIGVGKITICHNASKNNPHTIVVATSAAAAHLMHGDTVGSCESGEQDVGDDDGDDGDDDQDDVTPPIISSLVASSTLATSTMINWDTDEDANGKVAYATSSPVSEDTSALSAIDASYSVAHSLMLSDLVSGTAYYYFVESVDNSGNVATSTEQSFTTQ